MKKILVREIIRTWLPTCILILPLLSCGVFGIPDYELKVTIGEGVQGTPASGQHSYKDLAEVDYKYMADNYLHTVEVIYAGAKLEAEGDFTIFTNVTLEARLVDIRDQWTIVMNDANGNFLTSFDITFSGDDILGGAFVDTRTLSGTWDGTSNKITITYDNWEKFILIGKLFDMSGIWTNDSASGSWVAQRT